MEYQCWAVERLAIWKIRSYPKLLPEIDATEALTRANYLDTFIHKTNNYTEMQDIVKLHSIALIRFIKLIDELGKKKGIESVNCAAKVLNIPRWIVDLRHDVTHSVVPPVRILREGVSFALNWLKVYYWDQYLEVTDDETSEKTHCNTERIMKLIEKFYKQQHNNPLNFRKTKNVTNHMKRIMECDIHTFSKILALYLLPNEEMLLNILKKEEIQFVKSESTILPKSMLLFWIPVLKLFDTRKKFCILLSNLLSFSKQTSDSIQHRLIASWLKKFLQLKKRYYYKLRNPNLNWKWLLKKALLCENKYSHIFLPLMLENMKMQIPDEKKQDLMALLAIRLGKTLEPKSEYSVNHKIYTISDLEKVRLRETKIEEEKLNWKLCTDNIKWADWPVGYLPGIDVNSLHSAENSKKEENILHCT